MGGGGAGRTGRLRHAARGRRPGGAGTRGRIDRPPPHCPDAAGHPPRRSRPLLRGSHGLGRDDWRDCYGHGAIHHPGDDAGLPPEAGATLRMIIEATAPTRIDLAGGTLDIYPIYLLEGGAVTVNLAITIDTRVRVEPYAEGVAVYSEDLGFGVEAPTAAALPVGGPLDPILRPPHAHPGGDRLGRAPRLGPGGVLVAARRPAGDLRAPQDTRLAAPPRAAPRPRGHRGETGGAVHQRAHRKAGLLRCAAGGPECHLVRSGAGDGRAPPTAATAGCPGRAPCPHLHR